MVAINVEIANAINEIRSPYLKGVGHSGMLPTNTDAEAASIRMKRPMKFLLAVSGGPDSQVLLKAFPHVCQKTITHYKTEVIAVGIDHGLRPEADAELSLAEKLASSSNTPFIRAKVSIDGDSNIECKARDARYAKLNEIADETKCDYIVTAHHFDDKAETVLIRLLRGDGMGSLSVLPLLSGRLFRPMLTVTRADVMGYANRWGLEYATDPSNMDTKFLRNKIRHEIMPILESINPRFKQRLVSLSNEIRFTDNARCWVMEELTALVMKS